ncbi:MAG: hypothetical protein ABFD75_04635 [Smithella sp.]
MSGIKKCFVFIAILFIFCPFDVFAQNGNRQNISDIRNNSSNGKNIAISRPVTAVAPRELDIGTIGSGETLSGVFVLKNIGSGIMNWYTFGPDDWKTVDNQKLSGVVENGADSLRVEVHVLSNGQAASSSKSGVVVYPVEMAISAGNGNIICRKDLFAGQHRESIKVISNGGNRTMFVKFKIVDNQELARINLNPERLDMGCVQQGRNVSKKLRLTNKGKEILKWSVAGQRQIYGDIRAGLFKKEKYVSFGNEEIRGKGVYTPPANLKDSMHVSGKWSENDGYPSSAGRANSIKFHFTGTGLILYFTSHPEAGNLTVYLDDKLVKEHEWFTDQKEKKELMAAAGLANTSHMVTLVNKAGHIDVEGVRILGRDVMHGPAGWISIFPYSGSTTLETEYINVTLNTASLTPGSYGDYIVFDSNGGDGRVEVFVEVVPDKLTKVVDVFRYSKGLDYLFTSNPQAESKRLIQNNYVKEGIAFRLFLPDTPGTTSFYRWYNPLKKDHFYHHDSKGGGKQLQGYVFEGAIGNIATSRMTNTRELYRWFNPSTGRYFFATDPKGEKVVKKGYKFNGIAGYVR